MKFAHLIEINDPLNPLIDPLSRGQLWRGLVLRAEQPALFVYGLESCRILEQTVHGLARELNFGPVIVRDRVSLYPARQVRYETEAQPMVAAASLTMSIEEPDSERFYIRFEYDDGRAEGEAASDAFYEEFRHSAYVEADIDTVKVIRQLAADGRLGE
jgi:uridine phosphorylase